MRSVRSISVFTRSRAQGDGYSTLRHDKNLISPRIFNFGPRCVTAHVNVPAARIKWTKHVSGLVWHRLGSWKRRGGGGRLRRWRWFWFGPRGFAVSDRRSCSVRLLRSRCISLSPWLRCRGHLRRCSRVTGRGHIGFDCICRSDHVWLVTVASQSVMHRRGRNAIRTDCHVACDMVRTHGHVASGSASGQ
jgi:hypothetical protein